MRWITAVLFLRCILGTVPARADEPSAPLLPKTALVLPSVSRQGRTSFPVDTVEAQRLSVGRFTPREGDEIRGSGGAIRRWTRVEADSSGVFRHRDLRGGYLYLEIDSPRECVALLLVPGSTFVSVNDEPRVGDTYGNGWPLTPVLLHPGTNRVLVQSRGGELKPELRVPPRPIFLTDVDRTLPDLLSDRPGEYWLGQRIINATKDSVRGLTLVTKSPGESEAIRTPLPDLLPLSQTKAPCRVVVGSLQGEVAELEMELVSRDGTVLDRQTIRLPIRKANERHRRTFISQIDGSVQYYSVVPASGPHSDSIGLTLTLHGAGVEADGQAACYAPKSWTHIVAATNRRPFGFDWEDWGRLDALEVLAHAERSLRTDPRHRWLTGHSMGGHGTWHLGVTFPDRFAAIGPSAGWVSMFSYAGLRQDGPDGPIQSLLRRASSPSDTLALIGNLKSVGVYVLHGDRDDNVPITQARSMREALAKFHPDWSYHERPGAGHWWGNECVDWPPMFQFFRERTLPRPAEVRQIDFATASPGVSADCHWLRVHAQIRAWEISRAQVEHDPEARRFRGRTTNVARLALDLSHLPPDQPVQVELDGDRLIDLAWPRDSQLWLERHQSGWQVTAAPEPSLKGPHRDGGFKSAFRNRVLLVYGTSGNAEENAWSLQKARYDAETFWYRGNGAIEVIPDVAFDAARFSDRNVVLYGHAQSNSAWAQLLTDCPIRVERGKLSVGERSLTGDDLGCLFVYPRSGSSRAVVGVVGGTGLQGLRATTRLPYFVSGVGYPDLLVFDATTWSQGVAGVRVAGYFGQDWQVETGELVWRD